MVIFGGETLQTRRSFEAAAGGPRRPQRRRASSPSLVPNELWAFELRERAWRRLWPRPDDAGDAPCATSLSEAAVGVEAGADENSTVAAAAAAAGRRLQGYFVASYYETHEVAPLHPPARSGHTLALAPPTAAASPRAGGLLVFGGQLHPGGDGERMVANDLWLFDLTGCDGDGGWRQLHGAAEPPPRYQHAAATLAAAADDDDSTAFLVFGGRTPAASLSSGRCITWSARRRRRPRRRRRRRRRRGSSSR